MIKITSRKQALKEGLNRYFTGKECKYGHVAARVTSCGFCLICREKSIQFWNKKRRLITIAYKESKRRAAGMAKRKGLTEKELIDREIRNKKVRYECTKEWHRKNPLARRLHEEKRRALKLKTKTENITREFISNLLLSQDGKCTYCPSDLRKTKYHIDHKNPLCRGGKHIKENLQLLCVSCNLQKNKLTHGEYMKKYGTEEKLLAKVRSLIG